MFEGKNDGGWIICHHAWSQLYATEEIGEELCYQGNRGRKGIHCPDPGVQHWRHNGWKFEVPPGGKQVNMGRTAWVEHVSCDLWVECPLCGEGLVLSREKIGDGVHLACDVDCSQCNLKFRD